MDNQMQKWQYISAIGGLV